MIAGVLTALALGLAPSSFAEAAAITAACERERLGVVETDTGPVLCVRQSLGDDDVQRVSALTKQLQTRAVSGLVLSSAGGRVDLWLDLIEASAPPLSFVIVDGVCLSSCANYGFAAGETRIVPEGSLVGWHGGPTGDAAFMRRFVRDLAGLELEQAPSLIALGQRTSALYAALGISTAVLELSHRPAPPFEIRRLRRELGGGAIAGVAFPPDVLALCFGFTGLALMTHPGDDAATLAASWSKSRRWGLIARPRDMVLRCPPQTRR